MEKMEHDAFMDRARAAYAVVQTGETALYGNIISAKAWCGCKPPRRANAPGPRECGPGAFLAVFGAAPQSLTR